MTKDANKTKAQLIEELTALRRTICEPAHDRAEHQNRVLRAIRDINQLIMSEKDRDVLIRRACEILIATRGYQHAWIALIDESRIATSTAEAGLDHGFLSLKEQMEAGDLPLCCQSALDLGEVFVTNDPRSSCDGGGSSGVTVRIEHDGKLFGVIGLAVPSLHAKDPEEMSLVKELAGDLGLALHWMWIAEQQRRTVRELGQSEALLAVTLKSIGDAVISTDRDGCVTFMNPTAEAATGWRSTEATGEPLAQVFDIRSEETGDPVESPVKRVFREGVVVGLANHTKLIRRDGTELPISDSGAPIRDEAGNIIGAVLVFRDISERRKAEDALRESEERFRLAAESLSDVVYEWDLGTRIEWFGNVDELMGHAPGEFPRTMDGWASLIHPEDLDRVMAAVNGQLNDEAPYAVEYRVHKKDGSDSTWSARGTVVRDAEGTARKWIGAITDVTRRRRAEQALWLKNQVFQDSIAALSIADKSGVITEVNPAFLTLWGYHTKEEAIGGSVGSFFANDEDAGPVLEALSAAGRWEGDFLARHADGTTFVSRGLATAMKNERGDLIGYQSANLDVTEQRRTEDELKLRNRIAGIFLTAPDDEMYSDVLKVVLEVAQSEFGVFGYIDEDGALVVPSMTRHIWDQCQVPQKDIVFPREKWGDSIWPRAIRQKKLLFSNSPSDNTPQGHVRVSRNITAPIVHQGEVVGLLQVANKTTDYTADDIRLIETLRDMVAPILSARLARDQQERDRRRREEDIITLNQELDQRVVERTVELTAANKELEAFAYSVSHDLRAPLRGIDGFSKALLDDYQHQLDATARDYISRVRAGTQRMGTLIDDLLKLSRTTRAEMHHQRLDLGELGRKIAAELQRDEPDRIVDFEVSPGLTARGDRALLETALENLLRNAWKFTGHRECAHIELGVTTRAGERVYHVRDDGAGFDMAYVDKLFGPFQRLHDTAEFPGSGIGLAIVQRVILRHGGRIWAEGEVDKGATFFFTLPNKSNTAGEGAAS